MVELARYVAPAVFIEPELLRAVRVRMLPRLDVGTESDIWFSRLVRSRSTQGIRFEPAIREVLNQQLGEIWQEGTAIDRQKIQYAERVMTRVHGDMSPALALEERLCWMSLFGDRQGIESELGKVLTAVTRDNRTGLLRWWSQAWDRVPESVRETRLAWLLKEAASAGLGPRRLTPARTPKGLHRIELQQVLADVPDVQLGVHRVETELEVGEVEGENVAAILVPDTDPRLVDVAFLDSAGENVRSLAVPLGEVTRLFVGEGPVELRTARGAVYRLAARDLQEDGVEQGVGEEDIPAAVLWSAAITIGVDSYKEFPSLSGVGDAVRKVQEWLTNPRGGAVPHEMTTVLYNPSHQDEVYQAFTETLERVQKLKWSQKSDKEPELLFVFMAGNVYHGDNGEVHLILGTSTQRLMQTVAVSEMHSWIVDQAVFRKVVFVVCGIGRPVPVRPLGLPLTPSTESHEERIQNLFLFQRLDGIEREGFDMFVQELLTGLEGAAGVSRGGRERHTRNTTAQSLVSYLRKSLAHRTGMEKVKLSDLEYTSSDDMILRVGVTLSSGILKLEVDEAITGEVVVDDSQNMPVWNGTIAETVSLDLPGGLYRVHSSMQEELVEVIGGETISVKLSGDFNSAASSKFSS